MAKKKSKKKASPTKTSGDGVLKARAISHKALGKQRRENPVFREVEMEIFCSTGACPVGKKIEEPSCPVKERAENPVERVEDVSLDEFRDDVLVSLDQAVTDGRLPRHRLVKIDPGEIRRAYVEGKSASKFVVEYVSASA